MGLFSWRKKKKRKGDGSDGDMSFLDHLEELRWHIIRSVLAILVFAIVLFVYRTEVIGGIFMTPFSKDFVTYQFMCEHFDQFCEEEVEVKDVVAKAPDTLKVEGLLVERLGPNGDSLVQRQIEFLIPTDSLLKNGTIAGLRVQTKDGNYVQFQAITPYEQFMKALFYAFFGGLIFAFPYVSWELWRFIRPALTNNESKGISWNVFSSSMLFFFGIAFGYYIILPFSVTFLASFVLFEEAENIWRIGDVVNFVLVLLFGTGFLFQLPVIVFYLSKVGLLTPKGLRKYRRHAIVGLLVVAAIVTPPDPMSQVFIFLPLLLLYEVGIMISGRVERKRKAREADRIQKEEAERQQRLEEVREEVRREKKVAADREESDVDNAEDEGEKDGESNDDGPDIDLTPPEGRISR